MRKTSSRTLRDCSCFCGALLATVFLGLLAHASPFAKKIAFTQPDGAQIELWGEGDEFHAVFETLDGYTVLFDPTRRAYCYATRSPDGQDLISSGLVVGKASDPAGAGFPQHLRADPGTVRKKALEKYRAWERAMELTQRWAALKRLTQPPAQGSQLAPPAFPTLGNKLGLTLLIDFDDDPATIPQAEIVDFCNGDTYTGYGNNGSVKQYYYDNSNGQLIYSNIVTIYIRIPNSLHPKSWYNDTTKDCGDQGNLLIRDAIQILKALPNYQTEILPTFNNLTVDAQNRVVACNVFYAGGNGGVWSKGLWPHSWSLYTVGQQELSPGGKKIWFYQITDIGTSLELGTFCHENGHMLCDYPDIYDYDYDSKGGAGGFCLMNSGGHGVNPVQICAYLKYKSGWATVTELASNSVMTATVVASAGPDFNHFYRYAKPGVATEYYLMENRQRTGRDANIAVGGVAVWHVDELGDHNNQSLIPNTSHANYEVTLVQADNQWHFQGNINNGDTGDLYYSGNPAAGYTNGLSDSSSPPAHWWDGSPSGINFFNFSANGATMTFAVRGNGSPVPLIISAPVSQTVVLGSNAMFQVIASGEAPLAYQWRHNGVPLNEGGRIVGANSNRLTIVTAQTADAGQYAVVVSNTHGADTSAPPAVLTVATSPVITSQPQGGTIESGQSFTFMVTAVGVEPMSYQWYRGSTALPGASASSYTLPSAQTNDSGGYSVVLDNSFGSATSLVATLNVVGLISLGAAVDNLTYTWTTSGDAAWRGQTAVTHDGVDAAGSGTIAHYQQSILQATLTGPGWLSFWWKVSSEPGWDFLDVLVSGLRKAGISGEQSWAQRNVFVPAGDHLVQWVYGKDGSVDYGDDKGWVDQVTFTPGAAIALKDAVDAPELTVDTYGLGQWEGQDGTTHDGIDAAQSGAITDFEYTVLRTTVVGPGSLSFWWKVSSEEGWDWLNFELNGNLLDSLSGEMPWTQYTIRLGAGTHTLEWIYSKDENISDGDDAGWVDQIVYLADNAPPRIVTQPRAQSAPVGATVTLNVGAVGPGTLAYQWRKNAADILGATSTNHVILNAQPGDSGTYSVRVSNLNGNTLSSNAQVVVLSLAEALDTTNLLWSTSGEGAWLGQIAQTHDGVDAASSPVITHGQQATLQTILTGPGTLSFWWKTSSETNFDVLYCYVGGIERARVSGEVDWQQKTFSLPAGSQAVEWVYSKDASRSVGADAAWVDQVIRVEDVSVEIVAYHKVGDQFNVQVATTAGHDYVLEYKNDLAAVSWTSLPAVPGDGTVMTLIDPAAGHAQRFYRVRAQ